MITILSGTNRPGSSTRKIARHLEEVYRELKVPCQVLDLAELPLEVFAPGAYADKPAAFARFNQAILASSGLHVVTPEYNGGMPGVLKYFIDLLKFPESFDRRAVCFTGVAAGMWGALRPVEQLQMIFGYRNAHIYPERVFIAGVGEVFDDHGRLHHSELAGRLRKQADGFVAFVERLQGSQLR